MPAPSDASHPLTVPEAILRRRATRKFDPARPVPDDLLVRILGLATHAPSSFNLQPWRFLVVRTERNRQRLRACAFNQPKVGGVPGGRGRARDTCRAYETDLGPMLDRRVALGAMTPEAAAEGPWLPRRPRLGKGIPTWTCCVGCPSARRCSPPPA